MKTQTSGGAIVPPNSACEPERLSELFQEQGIFRDQSYVAAIFAQATVTCDQAHEVPEIV
jgi:hypothetical protein